jgi:hypothetical protein
VRTLVNSWRNFFPLRIQRNPYLQTGSGACATVLRVWCLYLNSECRFWGLVGHWPEVGQSGRKNFMPTSILKNIVANCKAYLHQRHRKSKSRAVQSLVKEAQPINSVGTVIFAELSKTEFGGKGKITAFSYLPIFSDLLRKNSYRTIVVTTVKDLSRAIMDGEYTVVVLIYGEDQFVPDYPGLNDVLARAQLVFNHTETGKLICNKKATHIFLSNQGVPMPAAQFDEIATKTVFSNHNASTGAQVSVLPTLSVLDSERYNTEFIDTRVKIAGEYYHTAIRLMCIGGAVTHSYVRARNVQDENPSVHAKNTAIDANLLNTLHAALIEPRKHELSELAAKISQALGLGFYSHDILIDSKTTEIYLAEVGFKFDDRIFLSRMSPVLADVPSMARFMTTEDSARNSFPAFLEIVTAHKSASAEIGALGDIQN